jgi:hypothetical protein
VVPAIGLQEPSVKKAKGKEHTAVKKIRVKKTSKDLPALSDRQVFPVNEPNLTAYRQPDSIIRKPDSLYSAISKIPVSFMAEIKGEQPPNNLIALNHSFIAPPFDDGRSRLSRFIAKTFREKLLKEKTAKDSPLKGYEIAEVGVSGLNKLLGWEMALDERKNENGELQSVYFSSRILKFNAPVKKSEPPQ